MNALSLLLLALVLAELVEAAWVRHIIVRRLDELARLVKRLETTPAGTPPPPAQGPPPPPVPSPGP